MEKIFSDNTDIAWRYIDIMDSCFEVGVADEGFSLMQQVNALLISPSQLTKVKSKISQNKFKKIVKKAAECVVKGTEIQLICEFHAKLSLDLPSITQWLLPLRKLYD